MRQDTVRKSSPAITLGGNHNGAGTSCPHFTVTIAAAERTLRTIAWRNGHAIKKRHNGTLKEFYGAGYGVVDMQCNTWVSGGMTQDGCDLGLESLAKFYAGDAENTTRQNKVLAAVLADEVVD
jgi:hypothetical protein